MSLVFSACRSVLLLVSIFLLASHSHTARVVWIGAVTSTSFRIHLDIDSAVSAVVLSTSGSVSPIIATKDPADPSALPADPSVYGDLRRFDFTDLVPRTKYYVATSVGDAVGVVASVRTFPPDGTRSNLRLALSACQWKASWDRIFEDVRKRFDDVEQASNPNPFFFLHMGDIAYPDITQNDVARYERALRRVLERDNVQSVFSVMPVPYMYDDHDYGANNAGFSSPSRQAALRNFRAMVPSYQLASGDASYHAFTVGTIRFIMMDLRSNAGRVSGSTLGLDQREWLFEEFAQAQSFDVVVWMNSKPWIGKNNPDTDSWAGFAEERRLVADKIAELGITNMVAVAGDAHMLAIDNGTYSDYSNPDDGVPAGFPVFQSAPIGNVGTSKGGPYSEGCRGFRAYPNYHYGILDITRVGQSDGPCVEFSGYKAGQMDEPLIRFKKCGVLGGVQGTGGQDSSCSLSIFPGWVWALVILGIILLILLLAGCIGGCVYFRKRRKRAAAPNGEFREQVFVSSRSSRSHGEPTREKPKREKTETEPRKEKTEPRREKKRTHKRPS